jgi:hypothetical protein
MKWKKKSSRTTNYGDDILLAMDIIVEAYEEGIIKWNVYRQAMAKIKTSLNGSWMFEQKSKEAE